MMNKNYLLLFLFVSCQLFAQTPQLINYQAAARNASGQALTNQNIALRLTVRQSTAAGAIQYQERHTTTTNAQGLFTVQIGAGTVLSGTFAAITWADTEQKHLQIELDATGGTNYTNMGTQQLVSVPYALVAGSIAGGGGSNNGWNLIGNAGTNPATNFVGTTDAQPLQFRVNNQPAGQISLTNAAIGVNALPNNTSGAYNTAQGTNALTANTTGNENTAVGSFALTSNTGSYNSALGSNALLNNTIGSGNTANGYGALFFNTTGGSNTANGMNALYSNTTGNQNTANGDGALYSNTTGNWNTANGYHALYSNTTGNQNTANGDGALFFNTTGGSNTANGSVALYSNTTGDGNTANGYRALYYNTTGNQNTANGIQALYNNTTGFFNTANGSNALAANTAGYNNTANGTDALFFNITGNYNTANGYRALYSNTAGSSNTAFGYDALSNNLVGSWNTCIGDRANVSATNLNGASSLGVEAISNATDKIVLGANIGGITIGGYANWSNLSDGRFKNNVKENIPGLSFITQLRPVTYTVDLMKLQRHITAQMPDSIARRYYPDAEQIAAANAEVRTGFIAQEVEAAAKLIGYNFDGINPPQNPTDNYSIEYAGFVPSLVRAVQEQQAVIEQQNAKITTLENELKQIKAALQLK